MLLSNVIIRNFIESIEEEDFAIIEALEDEEAFEYICELYERNYNVQPSGAGIYLLRSKFQIGSEETNRKFIPSAI